MLFDEAGAFLAFEAEGLMLENVGEDSELLSGLSLQPACNCSDGVAIIVVTSRPFYRQLCRK